MSPARMNNEAKKQEILSFLTRFLDIQDFREVDNLEIWP